MRRKHTSGSVDESQIDMTPMLDIVFIMLIFFIVTASFVKEVGLDISSPDNQEQKPKKKSKSMLLIITDTGDVWVGRKRRIDVRAVRANVEKFHAENPKGAVLVRPAEKSKSGVLVSVMDQVRLAGVYNVSIATEEK